MEQATLKIFRYHPDMETFAYKDYEVPLRQDLSVLKTLFEIADNYEDPPAFRRYCCNRGQCAGCVMGINGRMRRACTTRLTKEMTLEPAYGYPVIRDLVVDFGRRVFVPPDDYRKIMEGSMILKQPHTKLKRERRTHISVKSDVCKSCKSKECIEACWLSKFENLEDRSGRRMPLKGSAIDEIVCNQCSDPHCAESCPTGAIAMKQGMVMSINPLLCIGCGICMDHCSYGAIWMNIERGYAVKCDFCGGEPACVKTCPHGGLQVQHLTNIK